MADDGSGRDITIPSFLLYKEDADAIKTVLMANQTVRVALNFSMPLPHDAGDPVKYEFWSRPWDSESTDVFNKFRFIAKALDQNAQFTPHFSIYNGVAAGCRSSDGTNQCGTLCTNGGRYCATEVDTAVGHGVHGADVVTESLRRICLWLAYGEEDGIGFNWWTYMEEFIRQCHSGDGTDHVSYPQCVDEVYHQTGMDKNKIDVCMRDSGGLETDRNNSLLDAQMSLQEQQGIVLVPTALVNGAPVRGQLSSANLFQAICSAYTPEKKPDVCNLCEACADVKECVMQDGICPSR